MDVTFGVLDAFACVVFAAILAAIVVAVVSLGSCRVRWRAKMGPPAGGRDQRGWLGRAG